MGIVLQSMLLCLVAAMASCSSPDCKRKDPLPSYPGKVTDIVPDENQKKDRSAFERVEIYKYDGSLQCNLGHPLKPEAMARELEGITIYSQTNKPDGLMHLQVCGGNTGRANVYQILRKDLAKALSRGFKLWDFTN